MWRDIQQVFNRLQPFAWNIFLAGCAVLTGLIFKWTIAFSCRWISRRISGFSLLRSLILQLGKPLEFFLPLVVLKLVLPLMKLDAGSFTVLDKLSNIFLIVSFGTILIGCVRVAEDYVIYAYDLKKDNNIRERKIRTQLQFIRKLAVGLIITLTVCAILLTFERLRNLGAGLLTGVGVSSIIVGFAAQRSLGNFLAGLQIAFTQPIRLDDVLVVEGEWGRVEEITFTYVVVNIWDQRRLILPINYFIEKPFQNWTRNSAEIIGTAFLYLDYTAPVDAIRKEFSRLVQTTELWDKRVQALHVTNTTEQTIELRLIMSAADAGKAFELRCFVRENIVAFIQKNYPGCLPMARGEISLEKADPVRHG